MIPPECVVQQSEQGDGRDEVLAAIRAIIAQEFRAPLPDVEAAETLQDIPGMESLRILRAVARVEKQFGVELSDEAVFTLRTIGDLADLVLRQMAGANHG